MRRVLAVVCLTIATLAIPAAPAEAVIRHPCSVGGYTNQQGKAVRWSKCPGPVEGRPNVTQYRTWAKVCNPRACAVKRSKWRHIGDGRAVVRFGMPNIRYSTQDIRYRK